jgi:hypothetical protein
MKRLLPLLGLLLAAATAPVSAAPTKITVSGEGSVSMLPTMATVNATVETTAENAADATSQNNTAYGRIVAAVTKTGVARDDITLSYYNVNYTPKPKPGTSNQADERYGYTVSRSFSIKVREMDKAGAVVDALAAAGVTNVGGVNFGLADPSKARAEATTLAVRDARSRAEALAAAAGLHITGIARISQDSGGVVQPLYRTMAAAAPAPTQFDAGSVNVTANVTIEYLASP